MRMKVKIKRLILNNFKGIKNRTIVFNDDVTSIYGDNGTGKTTIVDAFLWLCFGKDSNDRADFNIKTLDDNNQVKHKLDHEVIGTLNVNGTEIELKRIYREKWQTKRGSAESEMTGHETVYFINEVPKSMAEYKDEINKILPEAIFKLVTSPMYFNSLKWTERRSRLMDLVGEIDDHTIANLSKDERFSRLLSQASGMTLTEYQKMIAVKRKKLRAELDLIPARIDEQFRSLPEGKDWANIESRITELEAEIKSIDEAIENSTKPYQEMFSKLQENIVAKNKLQSFISDKEHQAREKFNASLRDKESKVQQGKSQVNSIHAQMKSAEDHNTMIREKIETLNKERERLRQQWMKVNAEQFHVHNDETVCPTCHQELPAEMLAEKESKMLANFNENKQKRLSEISADGKSIAQMVAKMQEDLNKEGQDFEKMLEEAEAAIKAAESIEIKSSKYYLDNDKEYMEAVEMYEIWPEVARPEMPDNSTLKHRKTLCFEELDGCKKLLNTRDQIASGNARIEELKEQEKTLSQQFAEYAWAEETMQDFGRLKAEHIESLLNSMFPEHIKFKMFNEQINGGIEDVCDTLIYGVPWNDANNAAKINAGISIINQLAGHYGVSAPIFVDNAEAVTRIEESKSQMILLYVDEEYKTLEIV